MGPVKRPLPRTLEQLQPSLHRFRNWLVSAGAELMPHDPAQQEVIKIFAGREVFVVTTTELGVLQGNGLEALRCWRHQESWAALDRTLPYPKSKLRRHVETLPHLLDRDGHDCWLCGLPLGDDMTVEHLVSRCHGGPDHLSNVVLTHTACNTKLGVLPLVTKIKMREANLQPGGWFRKIFKG